MPEIIGKTIGKYKIMREIGHGGMGVVYEGIQPSLNRAVAIKMLSHDLAGDPEFVERFKREALAIAALAHENIVSVYDIEEAFGTHFIIMEYIDGENLALLIKRGDIPVKKAVNFMLQMAKALSFAHEHGIIHRDIKPSNAMVTKEGKVKLMDFGIAKNIESDFKTMTGTSLGTPHYMSPEQIRGKGLDYRSDIYSFGALCYEMFTRKLLFEGDGHFTVAFKHLNEPVTRPSIYRSEIPPETEFLILAMLEKDREKRLQSLSNLEEQLEEVKKTGQVVSTGERGTVVVGQEVFDKTVSQERAGMPAVSAGPLPKIKKPLAVTFAGVGAVVLAGVVYLLVGKFAAQPQKTAGLTKPAVVQPKPGSLEELQGQPGQVPETVVPQAPPGITVEDKVRSEAERRIEEGRRSMELQDYANAKTEFEYVLTIDPENSAAKSYLDFVNKKMSAIAEMEKKGKQIKELFEAGVKEYDARRYTEAVEKFDELLSLQPEHSGSITYKELAQQKIKEIKGGLSTAEEFLSRGYYDQAIVEFRKIIVIEPQNQEASEGLSKALSLKEKAEMAKADKPVALAGEGASESVSPTAGDDKSFVQKTLAGLTIAYEAKDIKAVSSLIDDRDMLRHEKEMRNTTRLFELFSGLDCSFKPENIEIDSSGAKAVVKCWWRVTGKVKDTNKTLALINGPFEILMNKKDGKWIVAKAIRVSSL